MSMSEGGNEGLFKLAEQAAPDPNRLMPTERKYVKTTKTLSLQDAMSLMKSRKNKTEPVISGGLDDPNASLKPKARPAEEDPFAGFTGPSEEPAAAPSTALSRKQKRKLTPEGVGSILTAISFLAKEIKVIKDRLSNANKEEEKTDLLERFKKEKHRVTFRLNEMEFTVTCLGMIKDASTHTLVIPFASDTESFFTPPQKSELKLSYDGSQVDGKLFYFGMSFTVPELGLRFLGFLYDDTEIGG